MDAGAGVGSGNASGGGGGASTCCYYAMLGIRKNASATDIRTAYRRLAMKWHPDRWASDPGAAGEAKRRFQRIQEAYSVLSDKGKKAMYDAGLFDPLDDDDQDFSDFMQEMLVMMDNVKNEKPDTLEDLQKMLEDIVNGDGTGGGRVPAAADGPGGRASRPTRSRSRRGGDRGAGVRDVHAPQPPAYAFGERDPPPEKGHRFGEAAGGSPIKIPPSF